MLDLQINPTHEGYKMIYATIYNQKHFKLREFELEGPHEMSEVIEDAQDWANDGYPCYIKTGETYEGQDSFYTLQGYSETLEWFKRPKHRVLNDRGRKALDDWLRATPTHSRQGFDIWMRTVEEESRNTPPDEPVIIELGRLKTVSGNPATLQFSEKDFKWQD
jgi:hypothetical protein